MGKIFHNTTILRFPEEHNVLFYKKDQQFLTVFDSSVICGFQLSDESSNTPRNFIQVSWLTFFLPNLMITRSLGSFVESEK